MKRAEFPSRPARAPSAGERGDDPVDRHGDPVARGAVPHLDDAVGDAAETVSTALEAAGYDVLYDDRPKLSPGVKFADAELIGVPKIVIAGRGVADGIVEIWDRATGDRTSVPIDGVVAALGR